MNTRTFAWVFGIVFLIVGVAGFIPALVRPHEHPGLLVQANSGLLFGLFPVNVLHNLVHIAFGVWGLVAGRRLSAAVLYARGVAVIYALLTIMGLIPVANVTFGLVPIYGHDVWLHLVLAAVAAYFGFMHRDREAGAVAAG